MGSRELPQTIGKQQGRFFSNRSSRESQVLLCQYYALAQSIWEKEFMSPICDYYDRTGISEIIPHDKQSVDLLYLFNDIFAGALQKFFGQSEGFIGNLIQMMSAQKLGDSIERMLDNHFRGKIVGELQRLCIAHNYFVINMLRNHLYQGAYQLVVEKKIVAREMVRVCGLPSNDLDVYLSAVFDRFADIKYISQIVRQAIAQYDAEGCFGNCASIYRFKAEQLAALIGECFFSLGSYCKWMLDGCENRVMAIDRALESLQKTPVKDEIIALKRELINIDERVDRIFAYLSDDSCDMQDDECEALRNQCCNNVLGVISHVISDAIGLEELIASAFILR
ncbi:MAG: hypothetical protein KAS93_01295 [Gammaproteobacteria bacterium]|nr:hypothetical protein [Gammaproteobacteria bacterium]